MSRLSRLSAVSFASLLAAAGAGCGQGSSAAQQRASYDGTMAESTDGKFLYTANADTGTVSVLDADQRAVTATVQVGAQPARIAVGPDDTLYVTDRGSRAVSIIHRGNWTEAGRIAVGAEPIGLAVSNDGSTLYVVSSASATLDAYDLTTASNPNRWEAQLTDEPRNVAVLPDGRLYVTHYKTGMVDVFDGSGNLQHSISTAVGIDPSSAGASVTFPNGPSLPAFRPVGLDSIVVSPDGTRAYLVHRRDRTGVLQGGSQSSTPVVVPALTTIDATRDLARDDVTDPSKDFPPPIIFPGPNTNAGNSGSGSSDNGLAEPTPSGNSGGSGGGSAYGVSETFNAAPWTQGPVAAVLDPAGQLLYVANENSDDVTVIATQNRHAQGADNAVVAHVAVGFAPSGLALSPDGKTLFVHNGLDYSVSVVQSPAGSPSEVARVSVSNAGNVLSPSDVEGRRLFFSATDPSMTVPGGGLACESCHLEGGNDGNVWQFAFGPRKTPSLLGRQIKETPPYHWDGTETDFTSFFQETVQVRMGGLGVSQEQQSQITGYLEGLHTPDNPFIQPGGLTPAQQAGKALFAGKAACIACHSGPQLTDNGFHDVGTLVTSNPNGMPDDTCRLTPNGDGAQCMGSDGPGGPTVEPNPANTAHGFNTPSLLGVLWAAPYLHDGSAATLKDRILNNPGNVHGNTAALSADEVDELVQYLQTL